MLTIKQIAARANCTNQAVLQQVQKGRLIPTQSKVIRHQAGVPIHSYLFSEEEVTRWESEKRKPRPDYIQVLTKALEISAYEKWDTSEQVKTQVAAWIENAKIEMEEPAND